MPLCSHTKDVDVFLRDFPANQNYSIDEKTWALLGQITSLFNTTLFQTAPAKDSGMHLGPILYNSNIVFESPHHIVTSMIDNKRSGNGAIHVPKQAFRTETYIHVC